MDQVMGTLIDTLSRVDADTTYELGNAALLNQTVTAAQNAANTTSDVSFDGGTKEWKNGDTVITKETANDNGLISWGGKMGSLTGTGGVAILEAAKDAITTFVGNISGIGANQKANTKIEKQAWGQV
jgi:hypothetical protein